MKKKSIRRRGSALVIVLGILAVMMLMAVAFSTFVRTERGGTTNLKNAFVARTSLFTAVGRAMEAIDLSFGSATNDDPVAAWPKPWLASAEGGDRFQSAELGDGETAGAHVLTDKIAQHLTPAQLALARAAKCNWAPIYSSINASPANSGRNGGSYGDYGRPTEDSLIGRYAFIALDTTGLLDMNQTGAFDPDLRKTNTGDPMTFDPPAGVAKVTKGNRSVDAPPFVLDPESFIDTRESKNLFHSMADAKALCGKSVLAIDETKAPANGGAKPATAGDFFPADLFAGFAPSLAETNPEGNPKIHLPSASDFSGWSAGRIKNFLSRSYRAMVGVFARSRAIAGLSPGNAETDLMTIFQSTSAQYQLSPAALATVSLLDGLDDDNVPGTSDKQSLEYWKELPSVSVKVEGDTVADTLPPRSSIYNFPCTESAPLLDAVRAEISFSAGVDNNAADWTQRTITYNGTIKVSAHAHCQNRTSKANSHHSKIKVEWEVMKGAPLGNTISADSGTEIRDALELVGSTGGGGGGGGGRPGGGGGGGDTAKLIDWSGFFEKGGSVTKGSSEAEADLEDSSDGGSRVLTVDSEVSGLSVVCHFYTNAVSSGGGSGGGGRPGGGGGGSTVIETKPYPMTAAEWNGGQVNKGVSDVFIPIRIKVTITDENGSIQQQVPAPALESARSKGYWLRVNPAVYHNPGDTDETKKSKFGGTKNGSTGDLAFGWAFCAAPTFAFDTTSLLNAGNYMNFWVSDEMARAASDQGGGGGRPPAGGGGGDTTFSALKSKFWTDGADGADPNSTIKNAMAGPRGQYIWGYLQKAWLFNDASGNYTDKVTTWMSKGGGRAPDMMHSAVQNGTPFVSANGGFSSESRAIESYSRFPANGEGYASVADLGRVMCGPYETLSLFKTWRPMGGRADFHPVVDYFTTGEDRYPKQSDVDAKTSSDGTVNWTALGQGGKDLYSAVHNGRVNLNAPPLVELSKDRGKRGRRSGSLNPYPFAAALNGAPYPTSSGGTNALTAAQALTLASTLCKMIEDSNLDEMEIESEVWDGSRRKVVRNLSFLGMGEETQNTFLNDIIGLAHPQTDAQREGILHGVSDAFTTRGQTYLLIIRADAYSPKFGENDSVQDGTTLATTHAIVELFRDPVPAHGPDGVLLPSDGEGPVAYHNWYIRSFRVF